MLKTEKAESSEAILAAWDHFTIGTQSACSWKIACFWPVLGTTGDWGRKNLWAWKSNLPFIPPMTASPTELNPRSGKHWPALAVSCSVFSSAQKRGTLWVPMLLPLRSIWGRAEVWHVEGARSAKGVSSATWGAGGGKQNKEGRNRLEGMWNKWDQRDRETSGKGLSEKLQWERLRSRTESRREN